MALQANDVQIAGLNQSGIRRTVWRMAGHATLGFDRLVLKNKGSLFVRMAGVADLISRGCRAQLLADKSAVRVVTIRALNQSLFHPMVERHVELRFDLLVTAVTQSGLSLGQEELILHSTVNGVATQAAQVILAMRRAGKVHVISARRVAFQAALVDFLCRRSFETENLLGIAGIVDMAGSRPVAGFASLLGGTTMSIKCGFPVRGFVEVVENILVAGLASFGTRVFSRRRLGSDCLFLSICDTCKKGKDGQSHQRFVLHHCRRHPI